MNLQFKAITFDFYRTLVYPRGDMGRGRLYHMFLQEHGLTAEPWDHQVLYDVFECYFSEYDPNANSEAKLEFWARFTSRLFARTKVVGAGPDTVQKHAADIRDIFGPGRFDVYPEVHEVLNELKITGVPLAIVSNWQKGLTPFCQELGLRHYFTQIISSAEVGYEKPDPRIFLEVSRRLNLAPADILHIGDTPEDDLDGATAAGFCAILIARDGVDVEISGEVIANLSEIPRLINERIRSRSLNSPYL